MTEKQTVLLVGGQLRHLGSVRDYLARNGFAVDVATATNGTAVALYAASADILVLDLGMSSPKALALARRFRRRFDLPLVVIGDRNDATFRIVAVEAIADDFLTKPYDRRELVARVRLALRRTDGQHRSSVQQDGIIDFDGWAIDLRKRRLTTPAGADVNLTPIEFDLLATFARHANRVVNRETLMREVREVRDRPWSPLSRSIDVHVGHLRRKIEPEPKQPQLIKTIHGVGYMFTPQSVGIHPVWPTDQALEERRTG